MLDKIRHTISDLSPSQLTAITKMALAKAEAGCEDARVVYAIAAAEHERRVGPAPKPRAIA